MERRERIRQYEAWLDEAELRGMRWLEEPTDPEADGGDDLRRLSLTTLILRRIIETRRILDAWMDHAQEKEKAGFASASDEQILALIRRCEDEGAQNGDDEEEGEG